ncbi:MAG: hypothetical protein AB8F95_00700 [Bacteroidia bacterium]
MQLLFLELLVIVTAFLAIEKSWIGPLMIPLVNVPINLLAILFFAIYESGDNEAYRKQKEKTDKNFKQKEKGTTWLILSVIMMLGIFVFNTSQILGPSQGWPFG